jgi:RNA polymerase sigma factor (sigma-70 family)
MMDKQLRVAGHASVPDAVAAPHASFEEFFLAEKGELFAALCMVTRDPYLAEELVQDAFVRVLERWDRVSVMEGPRAYLYRTAMNVFRSRYRRSVVAARRSLRPPPPDDLIDAVDADDAAMRALSHLSERQRAAVVLTDLLGFPSEEAARMLGIRASTVRVHVSRAHAALKEVMGDG